MKDLESMLTEGENGYENHERHLSNDSAVGDSECVSSPLTQSHSAQPSSADDCAREVSNSVDSAFSNNSSHTNSVSSSEAINTHIEILTDSTPYTPGTSSTPYASSSLPLHARMSSGVSMQSDNAGSTNIIQAVSPKLPHKAMLVNAKFSSMPILDPELDSRSATPQRHSTSSFRSFWKSSSAGRDSSRLGIGRRRKRSGPGSVEDMMPEYNPRRSPILRNSPVRICEPEHNSIETTPTGSLNNDSTSASFLSENRFHYKIDPSTEVLI